MNNRAQLIDRAIMATLRDCGDYLQPEEQLCQEVMLRVSTPRVLASEFNSRRNHLESKRLILGIPTDYGTKWKLTDEGRAWCAENL